MLSFIEVLLTLAGNEITVRGVCPLLHAAHSNRLLISRSQVQPCVWVMISQSWSGNLPRWIRAARSGLGITKCVSANRGFICFPVLKVKERMTQQNERLLALINLINVAERLFSISACFTLLIGRGGREGGAPRWRICADTGFTLKSPEGIDQDYLLNENRLKLSSSETATKHYLISIRKYNLLRKLCNLGHITQ